MLKYTRPEEENISDKLLDMAKSHTQNHSSIISNLNKLNSLLHEHWQRRLRKETNCESRLTLFLDESRRMEEIHAHSLSQLQEHMNELKKNLTQNPTLCLPELSKIEGMLQNLYGLFPNK